MAAARTTSKPTPETPEATDAVQTPEVHVDRVAMPTLRADGTPMQTPGWVHLLADEPDTTEA